MDGQKRHRPAALQKPKAGRRLARLGIDNVFGQRVHRWPTRPRSVSQHLLDRSVTPLLEAMQPQPHNVLPVTEDARDLSYRVASQRQHHDMRTLRHPPDTLPSQPLQLPVDFLHHRSHEQLLASHGHHLRYFSVTDTQPNLWRPT
jgi:hypothetical protein